MAAITGDGRAGGSTGPVTSRRRLSLRARMLIVLIAVTATFLLIMGGVTAIVLSNRLSGEFNADLVAAAARNPRQLADNPGGFIAEAVSARTGQVVVLTPGAEASALAWRPGPDEPGRLPQPVRPRNGHHQPSR